MPGEALEEEQRAGMYERRCRAARVPGGGRGRALAFGKVNGEKESKEIGEEQGKTVTD